MFASTGGLAVDRNLGWKGAGKYVAIVPHVFDLHQDPQERYGVFTNNHTERTWTRSPYVFIGSFSARRART